MNKFGLAFLQNTWLNNPEKAKKGIAKWGETYRTNLIEYCLFAGCLTGRRIKAAFSENLRDTIVWEETTREISGNPKEIFPADLNHIKQKIQEHQPKIILAFGKTAEKSLTNFTNLPIIFMPHPAARQEDVMERLKYGALEYEKMLSVYV